MSLAWALRGPRAPPLPTLSRPLPAQGGFTINSSTSFATKFAETSLALFGDRAQFAIDPNGMSLEEAALAFESLGCRVEREPLRGRLIVYPPATTPDAS